MMPMNSAIFRLSITIASAILLASLLAMLAIYTVTEKHLDANLQMLVKSDLKGYSDLYAQRRIIAIRQAFERRSELGKNSNEVYLLLDKKGKKLAGNISQWPKSLSKQGGWQGFSIDEANNVTRHFLGASELLPGGFPIFVARSTASRDGVLYQLRWAISLSVLVIMVVSILLGRFLSNHILGRISAVNAVCEMVENGDLTARVKDGSQDEFAALANHINTMLDRISSLMRGTKEVSDRIAHELRTPLNRILLRVASIQEMRLETKLSDELSKVSSDLNETIEVFEALLDIAETEVGAHDNAGFAPVDMALVMNEILSLYQAVAEEKSINISTRIEESAYVLGDKNLLARAIANLLDNAVKFSPQNGEIHIDLTCYDKFHLVTISDNGPGLESEFKERVFERFSRGRNVAETPGHGLGLAIVQTIAIRHGIQISLKDNHPGLSVSLECPAYQHQKVSKNISKIGQLE